MLNVRKLKLNYDLNIRKYVMSTIDNCEITVISKIVTTYTYDNKIIFKRFDWDDLPTFYCDDYLFWSKLYREYEMSYEEIKILIRNILENYYDLPNFEVMVTDLK